jgi:predicted transposase YbfD/YdcC
MTESGKAVGVSLWDIFEKIPDPREASGRRFPLPGILALTVAALLAGRQGLEAIARWGRGCSQGQLARLGIERPRSPCHATYHNVFKALDVDAVERALAEWAKEALPDGVAVAIDGKTLRGSRHADYPAVHLLCAYCDAVSGVLGQTPVETNKENEITAAAELLKGVPMKGRVITGDAMFAQKSVCQAVLDGGGDYLVTVKDNQPSLREAIDNAFAPASSPLGGAKAREGNSPRRQRGKSARTP